MKRPDTSCLTECDGSWFDSCLSDCTDSSVESTVFLDPPLYHCGSIAARSLCADLRGLRAPQVAFAAGCSLTSRQEVFVTGGYTDVSGSVRKTAHVVAYNAQK